MALVAELNPEYPSIADIEKAIGALYKQHKDEYRQWVEAQGLDWKEEERNDSWKGTYPYKYAEYRDSQGRFVQEREAKEKQADIWVWQEDNSSMPSGKQSPTTSDINHPNYRFYKPPRLGV